MDLGTDIRRLAIEIIAKLVHLKRAMADLVLRLAGIPEELINAHLYRRDPSTERLLSKREMAPGLLDAVEKRQGHNGAIRQLVEIWLPTLLEEWDRERRSSASAGYRICCIRRAVGLGA
jgi:hypothetical protein